MQWSKYKIGVEKKMERIEAPGVVFRDVEIASLFFIFSP